MRPTVSVHVRYFAMFREQSGLPGETVETTAASAAELYEELRARHGFTLSAARVRVAVNQEFVPMAAPFSENDEIVFVPPVAGG
jgi:molybdopterin converting factor subunit 1